MESCTGTPSPFGYDLNSRSHNNSLRVATESTFRVEKSKSATRRIDILTPAICRRQVSNNPRYWLDLVPPRAPLYLRTFQSALVATLALASNAIACDDTAVTLEVQQSDQQDVVFANVSRALEATVTLNAKLDNMKCNVPLPTTAVLTKMGRTPIATFSVDNPQQPTKYKYEYSWQKGLQADTGYVKGQYVVCYLPYPRGASYEITQGFFGGFSHFRGSQSEYAVDFNLAEGETICAALPGVVIGLRADSTSGGVDRKFGKCGNYIVIKHRDGTYGEYVHLRTNGVLVKLGQEVQALQAIGQAGQTGQASAPHLHFAVYKIRDGNERFTLPIVFKTSAGILTPKAGEVFQNN